MKFAQVNNKFQLIKCKSLLRTASFSFGSTNTATTSSAGFGFGTTTSSGFGTSTSTGFGAFGAPAANTGYFIDSALWIYNNIMSTAWLFSVLPLSGSDIVVPRQIAGTN